MWSTGKKTPLTLSTCSLKNNQTEQVDVFSIFSIAFVYSQRSIVKNEALTMHLVSMGQHILEIMAMFYSYTSGL